MAGPGEHVDGLDGFELIVRAEPGDVAREGGRIAGDIEQEGRSGGVDGFAEV